MTASVRVRFAPSPTGRMHMGNVRAALLNYLFARQQGGTFILRIEDTDEQRNTDDGVDGILADLAWCGMTPDEGPGSSGDELYYQSHRQELYIQSLGWLIHAKRAYKCFCTQERLEQMRASQRAVGLPPRYDGTCRALPEMESNMMMAEGTAFIWRFARHDGENIQVPTFGEPLSFDMSHFHDFAITRADESFTFLFTNAVDDIDMGITHVMRGSDHLSNTALQAALYVAYGAQMPTFIHLPLLCNSEGKKMSKRDFGFSLADIQQDGIVPEALAHYLLTIGSTTINGTMSRDELIAQPLEKRLQHTGQITYDLDALHALNRAYIHEMPATQLSEHVAEYERMAGQEATNGSAALIGLLQKEVNNIAQLRDLVIRTTQVPVRTREELVAHCGDEATMNKVLEKARELFAGGESAAALGDLKAWTKAEGIGMKIVLGGVRYAVTGLFTGIGMGTLVAAVSEAEITARLGSV